MAYVRRSETDDEVELALEMWQLDSNLTAEPVLRSRGTLAVASFGDACLGSDGKLVGHICFDPLLEFGILGNHLIGIDYSKSDMDLRVIKVVEELNRQSPPVQWLFVKGGKILLAGSHNACLQDSLLDAADKHRRSSICFSNQPPTWLETAKQDASACDLCYYGMAQSICYVCTKCDGIDSIDPRHFQICSLCIQKAGWCRDRAHVLHAKADENLKISWRPSHFLLEISLEEASGIPTYIFCERLGTAINHIPKVDQHTNKVLWLLDEAHLLVHDIDTRRYSISPLVKDNLACK